MGDNPKNRGKRHVANKSKYNKNKPKATSSTPTIKSKSLQSNWDRYEEELTDDYVPVGSDFSVLANVPLSKGSHFQFKSEAHKIQDTERTSTDTSDLFNIDLNLIGLSLSTIPFNVRCGIPNDYFSNSQQKIMLQTAENNKKIYEQYLENKGINVSSCIDRYFPSKTDQIDRISMQELTQEKESKLVSDDVPKLFENMNLKTSVTESRTAANSVSDKPSPTKEKQDLVAESSSSILEEESLQQWLDDVLGE